jgi:hypothetical protein
MDKVLKTYDVEDHTRRVRVEGSITYFEPARMAVLQDGNRSIRVLTPTIDPLRVGDRAEAIGMPFVDNGFLTLKLADVRSTGGEAPISRRLSVGTNSHPESTPSTLSRSKGTW